MARKVREWQEIQTVFEQTALPVASISKKHGVSRAAIAVSKITIEWFPSEITAKIAERSAIKLENPMFNITHNRKS